MDWTEAELGMDPAAACVSSFRGCPERGLGMGGEGLLLEVGGAAVGVVALSSFT